MFCKKYLWLCLCLSLQCQKKKKKEAVNPGAPYLYIQFFQKKKSIENPIHHIQIDKMYAVYQKKKSDTYQQKEPLSKMQIPLYIHADENGHVDYYFQVTAKEIKGKEKKYSFNITLQYTLVFTTILNKVCMQVQKMTIKNCKNTMNTNPITATLSFDDVDTKQKITASSYTSSNLSNETVLKIIFS